MRSPVGEGRERLLQALFEVFGQDGPDANLSMRQVAERLGVHHTLLTYHFGSRTGLLSAVLTEARRRDNLELATVAAGLGFEGMCRTIWAFYSDPVREGRFRAFFHLVGLSIYDQDTLHTFVAGIDDLTSLLEQAAGRDGADPEQAAQRSLVVIACLRGLLLQHILTPGAAIDAAAEQAIITLAGAPKSPERPVGRRHRRDHGQ